MTTEEVAKRLDGRMYGSELGVDEERVIADAGLVVVFGYGDDAIEFRGAINDEQSAPGWHALAADDLLRNNCEDDECPYFGDLYESAAKIESCWHDDRGGGPTWTYKTDIPHSTFDIKSDDEEEGIYCRGIVFALKDLKR